MKKTFLYLISCTCRFIFPKPSKSVILWCVFKRFIKKEKGRIKGGVGEGGVKQREWDVGWEWIGRKREKEKQSNLIACTLR